MAQAEPVVLVVGDSLSAAYGIRLDQGWVNRLQSQLTVAGYPQIVVNASISGDTSRNALVRLPATLEAHEPEVVIVELGGNDGLRGISLEEMQHNLATIIELSLSNGAQVLLVAMRLPPNYGATFNTRFEAVYSRLAERSGVVLAPFILEGIAEHSELMQADGIHPREQAQEAMMMNLWPELKTILDKQRNSE